jgi:hypothetical protein
VAGSTSEDECNGILVDLGDSAIAYNIGLIILIIYMLSFSLVPSWSASDTTLRLQLNASFEGRLKTDLRSPKHKHSSSWFERIMMKFSTEFKLSSCKFAVEKRFFEVGDSIVWQSRELGDTVIGTVESTSVYHEQDADEYSDFVVFLKIDPSFKLNLKRLEDAVLQEKKPVLMDSRNRSCCCQITEVPSSHARMPVLGCIVGSWEVVRQINACFQLLLMSLFPAIDTISDLVYILSSVFANRYIFVASLFCITSQFWLFVKRLKQRRVFEAFMQRRIDPDFLMELPVWPKWASPNSMPVFLLLIVPIRFIYYIVFPPVWFLLGYAIYSFQLFPISRISNRWLYAFV